MEISNNTQSTAYTTTKQKETSRNDTSFDQYINSNSTQDTQSTQNKKNTQDYIEVSESDTKTETLVYSKKTGQTESYDPNKVFLNFLDENYPNYFEKNGISQEDEKAIRSVLEDNIISENEARQLSFEQAQSLYKIEFNRYQYGPENSDDMKILPVENQKVQHIIRSTDFSGDDTLNKSIHKTFIDSTSLSHHDMSKIQGELSYTLKQAYSNMTIGFNLHQAPSAFGLIHEFETSDFDYKSYLMNILSHANKGLEKASDPDIKRQYELLSTNFGKILDNYRNLQDKEIS